MIAKLAAATVLLGALAPGPAMAADYAVIPLEIAVDRPAEVVWRKVGGYCDIGRWLKVSCVITAGQDGDLGAVRRIADRIDEVLVARTERSYTYAQPRSPIDYHGTVEVRADGPGRSRILYSLIYDAEPLNTPQAKAADRDRRARQFTAILATMKAIAEAD
jgi:hypothetical protein